MEKIKPFAGSLEDLAVATMSHAERILVEKQSLTTMVMGHKRIGEGYILPIRPERLSEDEANLLETLGLSVFEHEGAKYFDPFGNEKSHAYIDLRIRGLSKSHSIDRLVYVTEAWSADIRGKDEEIRQIKPSKREDRVESIIVMAFEGGEDDVVLTSEVLRGDDGRIIGLRARPDIDNKSHDGLLQNMLD